MKFNASPTTSAAVSGADAAAAPAVDRATVAAFEALLVPALCAPVSAAFGPLGAVFSDTIARALVASESGAPT